MIYRAETEIEPFCGVLVPKLFWRADTSFPVWQEIPTSEAGDWSWGLEIIFCWKVCGLPTCFLVSNRIMFDTHESWDPWEWFLPMVPQERVAICCHVALLTAFGSRGSRAGSSWFHPQADASGDNSCQPWRRWESSSALEFESHFVFFITYNYNPSTLWSECDWCAAEELVIDVDMGIANESGVCVWDSALCLGEMLIKEQCLSSIWVTFGSVNQWLAAYRFWAPRSWESHPLWL